MFSKNILDPREKFSAKCCGKVRGMASGVLRARSAKSARRGPVQTRRKKRRNGPEMGEPCRREIRGENADFVRLRTMEKHPDSEKSFSTLTSEYEGHETCCVVTNNHLITHT